MIFTNTAFFVLMALVLLLYWRQVGNTQRKLILLVASYVFYGWWDWRFCGLLLLSSVIDWAAALWIANHPGDPRRRRLLWFSIGSNLLILGIFKYFDFFSTSFTELLRGLGLPVDPWLLQVVLPAGLSFYTFQSMSYTIDVYEGRAQARSSLLDILVYVAFFPQLVAGPIVRANEFLPQLDRRMTAADVPLAACALLFLVGLFKKAVLADSIGWLIDPVWRAPADYDRASLWAAMALFRVQLYCDFSGYSEMAIASAGLLGFRLPWNFDAPLLARNMADYWRRWHITLANWFRDYIYLRLPFRRQGWSLYRNLLLTMALVGLWHGAGWTFVTWGLLQGLALGFLIAMRRNGVDLSLPLLPAFALTFAYGTLSATFFRASSVETGIAMIGDGLGLGEAGTLSLGAGPWIAIALLAALHIGWRRWALGERLLALPGWLQAVLYGAAAALTLALLPYADRPFYYFQF